MAKNFKKNTAELFISAADEPQEAPQTAQEGFSIPKGYRLAKEYKSERMQLLVRPALKEAIKQEAEAQGLSMNELVNTIFEEYLERKGRA
jgi:predicted DNA binding CopG/RHH family protein